jgi:hypothetical protein
LPNHDLFKPFLKKEKENLEERNDEEDVTMSRVNAVWLEKFGGPIGKELQESLNGLVAKFGSTAGNHGIVASVAAGSRNFEYIARCA